jgi:UDP-N-acetylglucosamine 2-epimerase (non-hydrolysing)
MSKTRILSVVGARPNFMKMAPILRELTKCGGFESRLVHTGQHYDEFMSRVFFRGLNMPDPDFNLEVGSGSHAVQTAKCMKRFEEVCSSVKPDLVIVAGDVNSTLACSLTAAKLQVPVAHIEAGLRSFDRTMPEEINRIATDCLADLLFTTEESGNQNLRREGVPEERIYFVGNTMIDSLVDCYRFLNESTVTHFLAGLDGAPYFVATIHRPANVDDPAQFATVLEILESASRLAAVFFVTHPRTYQRLQQAKRSGGKLVELNGNTAKLQQGSIYVLPPLPYMEFLRFMSKSQALLTDSGGIQEESTFLGIPCLTLRNNTERPSTVELGTNEVVGLDGQRVTSCLDTIMRGRWKKGLTPPLWDGRAAERVVSVLASRFGLAQRLRVSTSINSENFGQA